MSKYTTSMGQKLITHNPSACKGQFCCIHNPSNHLMRDFRTYWRYDRNLMERLCIHGVGHPDPDQIAFIERTQGKKMAELEEIHGCDGCCRGECKKRG